MNRKRMRYLALAWLLSSAACALADAGLQKAQVKDIASIEGIRDNQLVGYGLVVGLRGTGDSQQTVFPAQTLISALEKMGVTVPQAGGTQSAQNMQIRNMAAVFVVATLPPFSQSGSKIDVTVSSAGDARSIEGGVLLMTPLLRAGRADLRAGAGCAGAGRLLGGGSGNCAPDESSHHGADSFGRARRAGRSF